MAKTNLQWAAVKICVWSSIAPPQKCEPPERLLFSWNEELFFLLTIRTQCHYPRVARGVLDRVPIHHNCRHLKRNQQLQFFHQISLILHQLRYGGGGGVFAAGYLMIWALCQSERSKKEVKKDQSSVLSTQHGTEIEGMSEKFEISLKWKFANKKINYPPSPCQVDKTRLCFL